MFNHLIGSSLFKQTDKNLLSFFIKSKNYTLSINDRLVDCILSFFTKLSLTIRPNNQFSPKKLFESMITEISSQYTEKSKFSMLAKSITDEQIKQDTEILNFTFFLTVLYNKISNYEIYNIRCRNCLGHVYGRQVYVLK